MTLNVTPEQILIGVGALLLLVLVWRAGGRSSRAVARATRSSSRLVSLGGRILLNASLLVTAQYLVFVYADNFWIRLAVLAVPALFASWVLTKALTVTTVDLDPSRQARREGRRR